MDEHITELARQLGLLLGELGLRVTTAESCTGGGIAEAITRIPGSSAWFEAGYITYSNAQKVVQLQVPPALLQEVGAVSGEVVEAMVAGACLHSGAACGVAVSGIAGPEGGTPEKPVGTVWIAWQVNGQRDSRCMHFSGDRQAVRQQTVEMTLDGLLQRCDMRSRGSQ